MSKLIGEQPGEARTNWDEFTETGFRDLLKSLKSRSYNFASFAHPPETKHVLWRHDVDQSLHRAARLAEIEAEEGARAVYFLNPRSQFYNLLEPVSAALTRRVRDGGHEIGLHFDASAFDVRIWTASTLAQAVHAERVLLESILGQPIRTMSWHNPDMSNLLDFKDREIGGLINAYADAYKRDYNYVSDSNGYWRFTPMAEVIAAGHPKLHLLTHPEWWTPEPLSPSERVDRCIFGRARAIRHEYDTILAKGGRKNLKS
ncbi:polysaccharide deacetylase family protein [Microvirga alba]|uniref:Uncharacterized protein n=1 Tax=Microvirga alba TaxID=2791025 RepID=A0A931BJ10_9HYPH|nr:hypothetical protein [Microvirga alba]MBF9231987.1 hypothetical protein [Microvirga alba]